MAIYMDHNATTPVAPEVVDAMLPFLRGDYGNPSSVHAAGRAARDAVERARRQVASLIGAAPDEVVFCGSGTEANNLALRGAALARERGDHLLCSPIEHHAVGDCVADLARDGVDVEMLRVGADARVDPDEVAGAVRDDTFLVSVMHANNETGTVQPIDSIGRAFRGRSVLLHTDAVQSAGKLSVDVEALGADLLSLSAHKFHGPKGVGALYVRRGTTLRAIIQGGAQEGGLRPGTYNVPGIVGMGAAAERARRNREIEGEYVQALRERLDAGLHRVCRDVFVVAANVQRLPGTMLACFPGHDGVALAENLDLQGIAVSTGSACSSGATGPSHVLRAIGLQEDLARGAVRFSLGGSNSEEDVDRVVSAVRSVVRPSTGKRLFGAAKAAVRAVR